MSSLNRRLPLMALVAMTVVTSSLIGCSGQQDDPTASERKPLEHKQEPARQEPARDLTVDAVEPDVVQSSYITARSLEELVQLSKVIVIGEVTSRDDTVNMARDIDNISEPDPNTFIVGQSYQVDVQRYLKGSGKPSLEVLQPEGMINMERSSPTQMSIDEARRNYPHIPMVDKKTYLLFLTPALGFSEGEYFTGELHPWRFALPPDGMAQPESPWNGAQLAFPPAPSDQLIEEIEGLIKEAE